LPPSASRTEPALGNSSICREAVLAVDAVTDAAHDRRARSLPFRRRRIGSAPSCSDFRGHFAPNHDSLALRYPVALTWKSGNRPLPAVVKNYPGGRGDRSWTGTAEIGMSPVDFCHRARWCRIPGPSGNPGRLLPVLVRTKAPARAVSDNISRRFANPMRSLRLTQNRAEKRQPGFNATSRMTFRHFRQTVQRGAQVVRSSESPLFFSLTFQWKKCRGLKDN